MAAVALAFAFGHGTTAAADPTPAANAAYRVGDRLSQPARQGSAKSAENFKLIGWETLIPKGWDPLEGVDRVSLSKMQDRDPRAIDMLMTLKKAWSVAPIEPKLENARVRIAGFYIPLDPEGESSREFLLVPFFGACIHTPPPPSNQVIHVILPKATKDLRLMDALWVSGTMSVARAETAMGASGYRMLAASMAPYEISR